MKLIKFAPKKNVAQAMVEFAIVLPILLLLLYGLLEAGRLLFMYSTIVTASRQAVRYGTATGQGIGTTTVPRYDDCVGIRDAAQKGNFLNAFNHENDDIKIYHDEGPDDANADQQICTPGQPSADWSPTNNSRLIVTITGHFNPIVPLIVPFGQRNIVATSARTILVSIPIEVDTGTTAESTTTEITNVVPEPSQVGEAVTVTVKVSNATGTATPTGKVILSIDGSVITGVCDNIALDTTTGIGTCTGLTFNTVGTKVLVATYEPDSTSFAASVSTDYSHVVEKADTSISISDPYDPSQPNVTIPLAITINTAFGTLTGTVNISASGGSGSCLGAHTLSGSSTINCSMTFPSEGLFTIQANYSGDTEHLASSGNESHTVSLVIPTHTNTPVPTHTFTPAPTTPTFTPTPAATPVLGCDNIKNQYVGNPNPIQVINKTMYLDITNPNPYPVSISHLFAHWNYLAGRAGGDGKLYLQSVTFNGQTPPVWTGNLNAYSLDLTLPTPLILPGNGVTSRFLFTFQTTYKYPAGEEIIIDFSTPGCELSSIHVTNP